MTTPVDTSNWTSWALQDRQLGLPVLGLRHKSIIIKLLVLFLMKFTKKLLMKFLQMFPY